MFPFSLIHGFSSPKTTPSGHCFRAFRYSLFHLVASAPSLRRASSSTQKGQQSCIIYLRAIISVTTAFSNFPRSSRYVNHVFASTRASFLHFYLNLLYVVTFTIVVCQDTYTLLLFPFHTKNTFVENQFNELCLRVCIMYVSN